MDEFRGRHRKGGALSVGRRRPVGETAADRHQDVGVRRRVVAGQRAWPADRPGAQPVVLGERTLAVPGEDDGNGQRLGQPRELRRGICGNGAAADDDAGAFGRQQQPDRFPDRPALGPRPARGKALPQVLDVDVRLLNLDIERNFHMDRPGPAGQHRVERAMHHERRHVGVDDVEIALGHCACHRGEVGGVVSVELLHDAVAAHMSRGRAGNQQEGRGIARGRCHADHGVGRARTDRRAGADRLAGGAVVGIRQVSRTLFVHDLDEGDFRYGIVERVEQAPVAVPRQADDIGHAIFLEGLADHLANGKRHGIPPCCKIPIFRQYCGNIPETVNAKNAMDRLYRSSAA